jgi:hypothetical protein
MTQDLTADESDLLINGLSALGGGAGAHGAAFAAKRMRADVFETGLTLDAPMTEAVGRVRDALAELGTPIDEEAAGDTCRLRAMIGAGGMNLNPTVVTVSLTGAGTAATTARIRGVAKEGLIKQRAGRKAAERVAAHLRES